MPKSKTDFAGLGGDSHYFRATGDARYYHELFEDIVGIARVQGGHIIGLRRRRRRCGLASSTTSSSARRSCAASPPSGIGPRDISTLDSRANAVGGTTYFGGSLEVQFPICGLPRELGLKGAVFADAGTLFGYKGPKTFDVNGNSIIDGFAPTRLRRIEPERDAGMHPRARQQR